MKFTVDNIIYEVLHGVHPEDKGVAVIGYKNFDGNIIIPSTVAYNEMIYKVIRIGCGSFADCTELTTLIIHDSVTSISHRAFVGCTNLTSVTISKYTTYIGNSAFYNTPFEKMRDKLSIEDFIQFTNETDKFKYVSDGKLNIEDVKHLLDKDEYCGAINGLDYGI